MIEVGNILKLNKECFTISGEQFIVEVLINLYVLSLPLNPLFRSVIKTADQL